MISQPEQKPEPVWQAIIRLLRWDKPAGRLILMIPALWAVFLAGEGKPPLPLVGAIVLGSLATSAAGCVVNDLWDRDIDPQVVRTRDRPLASRALSVKVGVVVAIVAFFVCRGDRSLSQSHHFWTLRNRSSRYYPLSLSKKVFPYPPTGTCHCLGFRSAN